MNKKNRKLFKHFREKMIHWRKMSNHHWQMSQRLQDRVAELSLSLSNSSKEVNQLKTEVQEKVYLLSNANKNVEEYGEIITNIRSELHEIRLNDGESRMFNAEGRIDWKGKFRQLEAKTNKEVKGYVVMIKELIEVRDQLKDKLDKFNQSENDEINGLKELLKERKTGPNKYEPSGSANNSPCKHCGEMKWNHFVGYVCPGQAKALQPQPIIVKVIQERESDWFVAGNTYTVTDGANFPGKGEQLWVLWEDFITPGLGRPSRLIPKAFTEIVS